MQNEPQYLKELLTNLQLCKYKKKFRPILKLLIFNSMFFTFNEKFYKPTFGISITSISRIICDLETRFLAMLSVLLVFLF